METYTHHNTDPKFTRTLRVTDGKYELDTAGTFHTGLYSVESSIREMTRGEAAAWIYTHAYDQSDDGFPEIRDAINYAKTYGDLIDSDQFDSIVTLRLHGFDCHEHEEYYGVAGESSQS